MEEAAAIRPLIHTDEENIQVIHPLLGIGKSCQWNQPVFYDKIWFSAPLCFCSIFGLVGALASFYGGHEEMLGPGSRSAIRSIVQTIVINLGFGLMPGSNVSLPLILNPKP